MKFIHAPQPNKWSGRQLVAPVVRRAELRRRRHRLNRNCSATRLPWTGRSCSCLQ